MHVLCTLHSTFAAWDHQSDVMHAMCFHVRAMQIGVCRINRADGSAAIQAVAMSAAEAL
jgi:hypothetical protein